MLSDIIFFFLAFSTVLIVISGGCLIFLSSNMLSNQLPFDEYSQRVAVWGSITFLFGVSLFFTIAFDLKPTPLIGILLLAGDLLFAGLCFLIALFLRKLSRNNKGVPPIAQDPSAESLAELKNPSVSGSLRRGLRARIPKIQK